MGDFSKGGVHKTDGLWWVILQRGEYTKNQWLLEVYVLLLKIKRPGRLFRQIRVAMFENTDILLEDHSEIEQRTKFRNGL